MENKLEIAARLHQSCFEKSNAEGCIDGYLNGKWGQSYKSFILGAQWQKENMWTSVGEDLPDVEKPVFVLTTKGNIAVSKMYIPKDCNGYVLGWKEWNGSSSFRDSIIAWMYKPKFKKG